MLVLLSSPRAGACWLHRVAPAPSGQGGGCRHPRGAATGRNRAGTRSCAHAHPAPRLQTPLPCVHGGAEPPFSSPYSGFRVLWATQAPRQGSPQDAPSPEPLPSVTQPFPARIQPPAEPPSTAGAAPPARPRHPWGCSSVPGSWQWGHGLGGTGRGASGAGPGHTPLLGGTSSHGHAVAQSGRQMPPKPARGWEAGLWRGGGAALPRCGTPVIFVSVSSTLLPRGLAGLCLSQHRTSRTSSPQPPCRTWAQDPGTSWPGEPGPTWAVARLRAAPFPTVPCPPGPAVLQLEPGRDAAGCAAPSPALPAPPKQPLSKGWSSKILTRAPSVYHTVNLGFQQLYDAAGRWERTKRSSSHSDTACVCQCPQRSLCARARGAARGQHPPASTPPQAPDWVITQTRTKAGRGFPDRQRGGCWC